METKEIKITPPKGYEIDKERSTFECIKFKPVAKRWRALIRLLKDIAFMVNLIKKTRYDSTRIN